MKRDRLLAFLTILSAPVLACASSVNAAAQTEVMNEKLLNAIRDADVQTRASGVGWRDNLDSNESGAEAGHRLLTTDSEGLV